MDGLHWGRCELRAFAESREPPRNSCCTARLTEMHRPCKEPTEPEWRTPSNHLRSYFAPTSPFDDCLSTDRVHLTQSRSSHPTSLPCAETDPRRVPAYLLLPPKIGRRRERVCVPALAGRGRGCGLGRCRPRCLTPISPSPSNVAAAAAATTLESRSRRLQSDRPCTCADEGGPADIDRTGSAGRRQGRLRRGRKRQRDRSRHGLVMGRDAAQVKRQDRPFAPVDVARPRTAAPPKRRRQPSRRRGFGRLEHDLRNPSGLGFRAPFRVEVPQEAPSGDDGLEDAVDPVELDPVVDPFQSFLAFDQLFQPTRRGDRRSACESFGLRR